MDSFEITKIVGAVCGSLLVFLTVSTAAHSIIGSPAGAGHGDEHHNAYVIEVAEGDSGGAEEDAEPEVDFSEIYASADAAEGEGLFRACGSCHKLEDGANAVGPHLYGVVGRDIAAVDGFAYSDALTSLEGQWTPEELSAFLENPAGYADGTKMSYRGMGDVEDRANLIAYLESTGN